MTTKMIFIWIYIVGEFEELMETGQKEIKKKKEKGFPNSVLFYQNHFSIFNPSRPMHFRNLY